MASVKVKKGKKYVIKIVTSSDQKDFISSSDREMDARAVQAVKSAIDKAKFCKEPIARYDVKSKKVYLEHADGKKTYVE